jgi:solute carrier family 36 (proton-coupled amino acid transporter)
MTSPTRPVNITSPRFTIGASVGTPGSRRGPGSRGSPIGTPHHGSATGTPDVRSLRAQYIGTPTLPNIPPRTGTPRPTTTPPSTEHLVFTGGAPGRVPSVSGISARRPTGIGLGLGVDDTPSPDPSIDIESFPEHEKVKVLRKHLVSREERQGSNNGSDGVPSRQPSSSQLARVARQEDSEAFPVSYRTPGADITYVKNRAFYRRCA